MEKSSVSAHSQDSNKMTLKIWGRDLRTFFGRRGEKCLGGGHIKHTGSTQFGPFGEKKGGEGRGLYRVNSVYLHDDRLKKTQA